MTLTRTIKATGKYLNLPTLTGSPESVRLVRHKPKCHRELLL